MPESPQTDADWTSLIPEEQWNAMQFLASAARQLSIPVMMGGALGLARYTGRWRNTKDLDFFILPQHRNPLKEALIQGGFRDYHETLAYDRSWIYRGFRDGVIVDLIWTLPNHRTEVEESWLQHAVPLEIRGQRFLALPPEELLWIKLYVLQRDRCDWPDVLNLLRAAGTRLDWQRLYGRLEKDLPLLNAILLLFGWLSPNCAEALPAEVRDRFGLRSGGAQDAPGDLEQQRVRLLDTRPWYAAFQPKNRPMEL